MTRRIGRLVDWLIDHLPEGELSPRSMVIAVFAALAVLLFAILVLNAHPWR